MIPEHLDDLVIDGWRAERSLGTGGLAQVLLVRKRTQLAALKLLRADASPASLARFQQEYELLEELARPGIVGVRGRGEWRGRAYMLMDFIPGRPLRDLIAFPPQPMPVIAGLTRQLAELLAYAHARGVCHRDVTPANVIVDPRGFVHVLDFGAAARSSEASAGRWPTTPAYAPPEWFTQRDADGARADAYALGVILYELLTGEFAFPTARAELQEVERAALDPGSSFPRALRETTQRLTQPSSRERATAGEAVGLLEALASAPAPVTLGETVLGSVPSPARPPAEDPRQLGRYMVLRRLGVGGMGVVFLAYDPELRREVAVKVLHARDRSAHEQARLRREAQAMAQLNHPNIVGVYDVGAVEDDVFVAMEYVEGSTLADRFSAEPRPPWRALLELLLCAGRGLVAAHDVGLVHRDFKPANVLLGAGDAVKVSDFGLARVNFRAPDDSTVAGLLERVERGSERLTHTGAVTGTPAYMAPEQFLSAEVDARSDQFSFCVALHEGLFGARPFAGETFAELRASVCGGVRRARARGVVPGWIAAALDRGLEVDPARRWPSMRALLEALCADPSRRRRRALGAGGVLLTLGASAGALVARERYQAARCEALGEAALDGWDDDARARVRAALSSSGVGHADQTWARVESGVDAWARSWRTARVAACQASRAGEPLAPALARCLDSDRWRLDILVEVLATPGREVANNATYTVGLLPEPARCEELVRLPPELRPTDEGSDEHVIEDIQRALARSKVLVAAGRYDDALERAAFALAAARDSASASLEAEALLVRGDVRRELGEYERAVEDLTAAWYHALRLGHDRVAAEAATALMFVVGVDQEQPARGREWGRDADAMIAHLGTRTAADLRWRHVRNTALLSQEMGAYDEARESFTRSVELAEALFGPEHPYVGRALNDQSIALYSRARYEEALAVSDRAVTLFEAAVGPEHPATGNARMSRGAIKQSAGDLDGALRDFESAAAVIESALGPDHPLLATAHNNVAAILHSRGDYEGMLAHARLALAIDERAGGPEDIKIARELNTIAVALRQRGDYVEAARLMRRSLAIAEAKLEPSHPFIAMMADNLGLALAGAGALEEAAALHRRSLAIFTEKHGDAHPDVALTLVSLADTLRLLGQLAAAREHAARALEIQEQALGREHPVVATTLVSLARAEGRAGETEAAVANLRRALAILETHPDSARLSSTLVELGELWIETRAPGRAVEPLTRAVALREQAARDDGELARARFALARALAASGGDQARARALAMQARDTLSTADARDEPRLEAVTRWLERRDASTSP